MVHYSANQLFAVKKILKKTLLHVSAALVLSASFNANATIVQFQTNMGNFEINLYDVNTPKTVTNFLAYVKSDAYKSSIVHRSVPGFVIQGGGYAFTGTIPPTAITQNAAVINEPVYANRRGTIAMAKIGDQPNSATNQWFINLVDNSSSLDANNGGFTVFGEVIGNGMTVVDAIAALNVVNAGSSPFTEIPMIKYTQANMNANVAVTQDNFVFIQNVIVLDANTDTAANLSPAKTTNTGSSTSSAGSKSSGGGGSIGWIELMFMMILVLFPKRSKAY